MTKRNPPILPQIPSPVDPLGSDEWHDIQQSVGVFDEQVKANEKKKSKESGSNSYASNNKKMIKKLKG
jgi:hypothetical protein